MKKCFVFILALLALLPSCKRASAIEQTLSSKRQVTASVAGKLQALNPLSILSRGYATVSIDGISVTSVKQVNENDTLDIRMADGSVRATVSQRKDIKNDEKNNDL